ncbi:hypothetical protein RJ639_025225 [Escallonia herrerae]|uniref:Peptidase M48 domain-containing protein n=1 Tax=Escallonia herrerae TaxID=1293975 RepID=A0AA88S5H9_9ASTE|nr:hypothetical protein RJ639_025225 [Escallonia herrerae]
MSLMAKQQITSCGQETRNFPQPYSEGVYSGQDGHGVAQHLSEKLMTSVWISAQVGEFIEPLVEEFVECYLSRRRELEADYIGLMIMASAGYDPRAATTFYKSLPDESYSLTHPSGSRRSKMLNRPEVIGKAVAIYEQVQASKGVESFMQFSRSSVGLSA